MGSRRRWRFEPVPETAQIGVDLVTRDEPGSDPARDRPQLAGADQPADVVLGAAELGGELAHRQGCRPVHAREYRRDRAYRLAVAKPPVLPYPPDLADDAEPVEELADLVDAVAHDRDWANAEARRLVLRRVELHRCRLTGAELAEASLTDTTFVECRLDLVGLRVAKLERVVFRDCRMDECDLYAASLRDVRLERCELKGATLSGARLDRVELRGCDLTGLRGAEALAGARLPWNDVLENAPLFAAALGVEVID
jgi:uncharacterized protein YjbI with pentapeptide repeats